MSATIVDPRAGWYLHTRVTRLHWVAWSPVRERWITLCGLPVTTVTLILDRPLCQVCERAAEGIDARTPRERRTRR